MRFRSLLPLVALALAAGPASAAPLRVAGRVLAGDEPGAPGLAGARVELSALETLPDVARRPAGSPETPPVTARTGADGSFELRAPDAGLYRLSVHAEGRLPVEIPLLPIVEEMDLPVAVPPPASEVEVLVLGPDGRPRAGIEVCGTPDLPGPFRLPWQARVSCAGTTRDGRLRLPSAGREPPGLLVTTPAFLGWARPEVTPERVTLRLASRPDAQLRVRDAEGRLVPGAVATLTWWSGARPIGTTGADGRLVVGSPGEDRALVVSGPDGAWTIVELGARAQGPIDVRLGPTRPLAGRVLDARSRSPLPGALVWVGQPLLAVTRADAGGRFRLPVGGGEVHLQAAAAGHLRGAQRAAGSSAARSAEVLLEAAGSLSGIVVDGEGRPVDGAEVRARSAASWEREADRSLRSGADGSFRFAGLPPKALFEVTARREGSAPATGVAGAALPGRPAPPLRLVLTAGATLRGRVAGEAGAPVAGARLVLVPSPQGGVTDELRHPRQRPPQQVEAAADAEGAFEVRHLAAGRYDLRATAPGFAPLLVPGIELAASPAPLDLGLVTLAAEAAIEGEVVDARGEPVAGAEVEAVASEELRTFRSGALAPAPSAAAATDERGRFRIGELRPGDRLDLTVRHPRHVAKRLPEVEAPTSEPLRIALVDARSIAGRVLGPDGEPVAGVVVNARGECRGEARGVLTVSSTDAAGDFRIEGLAPGRCDLVASAEGFVPAERRGLEVPAERDLEGLVLRLERGEVLEGVVVDEDGAPAADAMVTARTDSRSGAGRFGGLRDETDGDGRYRLEGLAPGTYDIHAFGSLTGAQATAQVEVVAGVNRLDLRLIRKNQATVSGRVLDPDGAPVAGAAVQLSQESSSSGVTTQGDGSFEISIEPGSYTATASGRGWADSDPLPVEVAAGQPVSGLELRLRPGGAIAGRLLGVEPADLGRVRVRASRIGRRSFGGEAVGVVDREGSYRISGLSPGEWQVEATLGTRRAERSVQLDDGLAEVVLDLDLGAGFALTGRLLVDGRPAPGSSVMLSGPPRPGEPRQSTTSHDSRFSFEGLEPGRYSLGGSDASGSWSRTLELDGDREVTIELETGGLAGRVIAAATAEPVEDAELVLAPHGAPIDWGGMSVGRSGADGAFALGRLLPGRFSLRVSRPGFAPAEVPVEVRPGAPVRVEVRLSPAADAP